VAALALHHALQYHWQGDDFRDADFNALDGQQLLDVLSMLDEEGLPDHIDVARRMKAYTCRVDPRQPVRGCGCCGYMRGLQQFFKDEVGRPSFRRDV
jgi:hypothetical protein